jgi:hypothetical protein
MKQTCIYFPSLACYREAECKDSCKRKQSYLKFYAEQSDDGNG